MQIKLKVILIVICDWMTLHGKLFNILDWIANCAVGSPVSANKPEGRENHTKGATSGSSEPSDEDDEAGACEQSTNPADMKRLRRYLKDKALNLGCVWVNFSVRRRLTEVHKLVLAERNSINCTFLFFSPDILNYVMVLGRFEFKMISGFV